MSKCTPDIISEMEYWLRLGIFLHEPLKQALLDVLHNTSNNNLYVGLPTDPVKLYNELDQKYRKKIDQCMKMKIIKTSQYLLIFPQNNETDPSLFDITLLVFLIINCTTIPPPINGWKDKTPDVADKSLGANCIRGREFRNELSHCDPLKIDEKMFTEMWNKGVNILNGLGSNYDTEALKNVSLDQNFGKYINVILQNQNTLGEEHAQFTSQLMMLQKEIEDVKCFNSVEREKFLMLKKREENFKDLLLEETLVLLTQEINDDWKKLAYNFSINEIEIAHIDKDYDNNEKRMKKCLELRNNILFWKELKINLKLIGRTDIIQKIRKETLITHGLNEARSILQQGYIKELFNCLMKHAFIQSGNVFEYVSIEDAYVELAIINAKEMDKIWSSNDREFYFQQTHFDRTSISMDNILSLGDNFVIVRGIAGIGKSTLLNSYILKWAKEKVLQGGQDKQKIDFLFKFDCRELNTLQTIYSVEELLKKKYPAVFEIIDFKDLEEIAGRILIILDGLDELKNIDKLGKDIDENIENDTAMLATVRMLLDTKSTVLSDHKTIVTGRPGAFDPSFFTTFSRLKLVEICGFNTKSVIEYVNNYFQKNKKLASTVLYKINESDNLSAMASIPVYLWVICSIYNEDVDIDTPKTTTALCSYACLLFIRNHLKTHQDFRNVTLVELCNNKEVVKLIYSLSELSFTTFRDRKVVFVEDDIASLRFPLKLEDTGFIVKYVYGDRKGTMYQFRHLVLQEYLSSLYIHIANTVKKYIQLGSFRSCLPIIAGLTGIEKSKDENLISSLIKQLRSIQSKNNSPVKILTRNFTFSKFNLLKHLEKNLMLMFHENGFFTVDANSSNLLSSLYEFQNELSPEMQSACLDHKVIIKNLMFYHDIRNATYVIEKLNIRSVEILSISNCKNNKLPNNLNCLFELYFRNATKENFKTRVVFVGDDKMSIKSGTNFTTKEKSISFTLVKDDTTDTHLKIVTFVLKFTDQVTIAYSVNNQYSMIKKAMENVNKHFDVSYTLIPDFSKEHPTVSQMQIYSDYIIEDINKGRDRTINLFNADITDSHIEKLTACISHIKSLDLSSNNLLTENSMLLISNSIRNHIDKGGVCQLETLCLNKINMTENHMKNLTFCLEHVKNIYLGNNVLTLNSLTYLSTALVKNVARNRHKVLGCLSLPSCHLTADHMAKLSSCLSFFETVNFEDNKTITPTTIKVLSHAIVDASKNKKTYALRYLRLGLCNLTDHHINELKPCITHVRSFDLSTSKTLTQKSMSLISYSVLKGVSTYGSKYYEELKLRNCILTDTHIEMLSPCIPYFRTFDICGNNNFTPNGIIMICKSVKTYIGRNTDMNLHTLRLISCGLTDEHILCLRDIICHLKELDISHNTLLTHEAIITIGNEILSNTTIGKKQLKILTIKDVPLSQEHNIALTRFKSLIQLNI